MRSGCCPSRSCLIPNGVRTSSAVSGGSTVGWASTTVPWPLLAEAVGPVGRQVGERIRRLPPVAILEVDVRAGRVTGRSLVTDQLALVHAVAGFYLEAKHVAVEGEEVVAMGEDDVVAI